MDYRKLLSKVKLKINKLWLISGGTLDNVKLQIRAFTPLR